MPKLVKIDAEGHEAKMIEGASKTFSSLQLQAVITETMKQFGFRIYQNDAFNRTLLAADDCNVNTIFGRDARAAGVRCSELARFQVVNGTI